MKKILAAVDFSDATDAVVDKAAEMAKAFNAEVVLLHADPILPNWGYNPVNQTFPENSLAMGYQAAVPFEVMAGEEKAREEASKEKLEQLRETLNQAEVKSSCLLFKGKPEEEIREQSMKLGVDMIIVGTHKHSALHHLLFGEMSGNLVSNPPCPVLIVPVDK